MQNDDKIISYGLDIIISILFIILGILLLIFWIGYYDTIKMALMIFQYVSSMGSQVSVSFSGGSLSNSVNFPLWAEAANWCIIIASVGWSIYGVKRLIDNILKIMIIKNPFEQRQLIHNKIAQQIDPGVIRDTK